MSAAKRVRNVEVVVEDGMIPREHELDFRQERRRGVSNDRGAVGDAAGVGAARLIRGSLGVMADPPRLLDRIRMAVRTRHYSIRTEEAYVTWARRYILFHNKRHPSAMGAEEIIAFLTHLAVEKDVSASTQNQALRCAR